MEKQELKLEERLIVALDFKPNWDPALGSIGRASVRDQVLDSADKMRGTGVCLKINSILRACGYDLIDELHSRGFSVFADLKLEDVKDTLDIDGMLLREAKPDLLTVMCSAGVNAMMTLKAQLPDTEILGVTVLTSHEEKDSKAIFSSSISKAVLRLANLGVDSKIDGFISSAKEVEMLNKKFGKFMTLNTPAIRPLWSSVQNDGQNKNRIVTPEEAIRLGTDRIVVGRPITQARSLYDAVMFTLKELHYALEKRKRTA